MACGATTCTSCTTTVQTTCPTMQAPCRPNAACPAGFTTVANGNSNKCYLVGSADVANFAAASVACAGAGGILFEPETALELDAVRAIIPSVTPSYEYYIGFTDIGNAVSNPVGFYSGVGLPANGIPYPLYTAKDQGDECLFSWDEGGTSLQYLRTMVIPYVIVVLCLVSPSTQFTGLGNTQVFDDAERASIIQTGESFPAQVSVVEIPLLLLLALLGGGTALTTTPAPGSVLVSGCPVCSTTVQTTCPTTTTVQCSPTAACPAGFVAVVNGDANKCYLATSTTVTNFGAASAACATVGGQLFEPRSPGELDAVRTSLIAATSTVSYFIGYSSINNILQAPVGFYTGAGLPANSVATNPVFTTAAANCVTVQRTGGYQGGVCTSNAGSNVLCEARLDKVNCVCP
ncbi:unnamed protein product [Mytilus edulis]|uniref:C-type lectin domain-containing protein n=1 Tax=Mytilus edulis TaxID=6550 RepID=A0A8S3QPG6_MYTED|nr:unnamed protein product [Mytilus edulis]